MEYAAIRHFADKRYCYAIEKGRFLIRLETKRDDVESVVLHVQDKYLPLKIMDTRQEHLMRVACSEQGYLPDLSVPFCHGQGGSRGGVVSGSDRSSGRSERFAARDHQSSGSHKKSGRGCDLHDAGIQF